MIESPHETTHNFYQDLILFVHEELSPSRELMIHDIGNILEAVHLETLTSYTLYSNILDLQRGKIFLYYMAQYDEIVELDIDEELAKGLRVVEMRDLFAPDTADAGEEKNSKLSPITVDQSNISKITRFSLFVPNLPVNLSTLPTDKYLRDRLKLMSEKAKTTKRNDVCPPNDRCVQRYFPNPSVSFL